MESFLLERKSNPTNHFVIGNDAGDADSIVSAISLAFIESVYEDRSITPIVSISKESFIHERPEVNLLFTYAGIQFASDMLLFVNDMTSMLREDKAKQRVNITLVDQNTLNHRLKAFADDLAIVEIVDHHKDMGKFQKTCFGNDRTVAFSRSRALVASACTLVAERLKRVASGRYPSVIGALLLGVILMDSVNLDQSIGKVTQRDRDAVTDILSKTDWEEGVPLSNIYINAEDGGNNHYYVDTKAYFEILQNAKYEPSFWDTLSVTKALGYDAKYFFYSSHLNTDGYSTKTKFGVAAVLMPGVKFMEKDGFVSETLSFMRSEQISFLSIMFAFYDDTTGLFRRELSFCSEESFPLEDFVTSVVVSTHYQEVNLQLKKMELPGRVAFEDDQKGLKAFLFLQENVQPSRKQIGPMLEKQLSSFASVML
mmetsp:Transcript_8244/g.15762  ORF Transcript_8244/g.15762 Transcript_8244/m.15762 type:complete len:426 (+) Transcript_8244:83-1360(+)